MAGREGGSWVTARKDVHDAFASRDALWLKERLVVLTQHFQDLQGLINFDWWTTLTKGFLLTHRDPPYLGRVDSALIPNLGA